MPDGSGVFVPAGAVLSVGAGKLRRLYQKLIGDEKGDNQHGNDGKRNIPSWNPVPKRFGF
jgi:hypothetical protein